MTQSKRRERKVTARQVTHEYTQGVAHKTSIGLYDDVKKNENFYLGEQWVGVKTRQITPVTMNFLRRVTAYFQAMVLSTDIGVQIRPFFEDTARETQGKAWEKAVDRVIERCKLKALNRESLRDCCVDGDSLMYLYFDPDEESGQELAEGDIRAELVMNTNVIFGNPASAEVQDQPYILIVRRRPVEQVREEARARGLAEDRVQRIQAECSSDLVGDEDQQQDLLATEIIRFAKKRRQDGERTVHICRVCSDVMLEEERDTGYRRYPMAWWSWERRKNSCHGISPITEVRPTQIAVNQLWTAVNIYVQNAAFPKIIYNATKYPNGYDPTPGKAIAVLGDPREAQTTIAGGVTLPGTILNVIEGMINKTMELMGVSDAALGNVRPDNQSAIIAVQEATAAPLERQRQAFYQFVEDWVRVIIDLMQAHYGVRQMMIEQEQTDPVTGEAITEKAPVLVDFGALDLSAMEVHVDVGQASYWSQLLQIQSADNLFAKGLYADMADYLEQVPDGYIRNRDKLVRRLREQQKQQAAMASAPTSGMMPTAGM